MPRRNLLTPAERTGLLAFPATDDELIQHYTFAEPDLSVIRQRRGSHNRLGFAVQLCYLRYPGFALPTDAEPPASLLNIVGRQLRIEPDIWPQYARLPRQGRQRRASVPRTHRKPSGQGRGPTAAGKAPRGAKNGPAGRLWGAA